METKPATMNTIPILYELIIETLTNTSSKARKILGEAFSVDLLNRTSQKKVFFKLFRVFLKEDLNAAESGGQLFFKGYPNGNYIQQVFFDKTNC